MNEYEVRKSSWDGIPNWDVVCTTWDEEGNFMDGPTIVYSCFNEDEAVAAQQDLSLGRCLDCHKLVCICEEEG